MRRPNAERWDNPQTLARVPRALLVDAMRKSSEFLPVGWLLGRREAPAKPDWGDPEEVFQKACAVIRELETKPANQPLTRAETKPAWDLVGALQSMDADTYRKTILLYEMLNELPLPTLEKLETIRYVGQHYYFSGRPADAVRIFAQADELSRDDVPPDYRDIYSRVFGNILYLKGLTLERLQDESATTENFIRMVSDPEVVANIPVVTSVSAYYRIGNLHYNDKQFAEAAKAYATGLKILKERADEQVFDAEQEYRIALEIGKAKADVREAEPDDPDLKELLKKLDRLQEEFQSQGYADFHDILRSRVETVALMEDPELYQKVVEELRDYYKKKYDTVKDWDGMQPYFLQSSVLLVKHLLTQKQRDQAVQILQETNELANPREQWFFQFPKPLTDQALQKSVLKKSDTQQRGQPGQDARKEKKPRDRENKDRNES